MNDGMAQAAIELAARYDSYVLLKGGHLPGNDLVDIIVSPDGAIKRHKQERIFNIDTHGSGCTLSSSLAAQLAQGLSPETALARSLSYLRRGMEDPVFIKGRPFINHFPNQA